MKKITHINPNCFGDKYCEPHGEIGEVFYSSKNIRKLLDKQEKKILDNFAQKLSKYRVSDGSIIIPRREILKLLT